MKRFFNTVRTHGIRAAIGVGASVIEDNHVRLFDRRFGVRTSGFISLEQTSINGKQEGTLHRYRGVNAWAFRDALRKAAPATDGIFVDLGCGLGRGCILAAQYGFRKVVGVELVPEFCTIAQRNIELFQKQSAYNGEMSIVRADAIDYTHDHRADVYFLFRPFSGDVLLKVLANLKRHALRGSPAKDLILFSERLLQTESDYPVFATERAFREVFSSSSWGQNFWGFEIIR